MQIRTPSMKVSEIYKKGRLSPSPQDSMKIHRVIELWRNVVVKAADNTQLSDERWVDAVAVDHHPLETAE